MHMPHIQLSISSINNRPNIIASQSRNCLSIVMNEFSSLFIEIIYSPPICRNPKITICSCHNLSNIIRYQTFGILVIMPIAKKSIIYIVIRIQTGPLRAYPKDRILRIIQQTIQFIACYTLPCQIFILQISNETGTIEFVQPFLRGKPQKALFVLSNAHHIIIG